jgi:ATP-dependent 26S proteasome regulatory subunit
VHGPAGVGKTSLIQSVLADHKFKVLRVTPSDLLTGDSFEKIKKVFRMPSQVVWFEEIDFIAKSKDKDLFYGFLE